MAYRTRRSSPERVLVVRPQRGFTGVGALFLGLLFLGSAVALATKAVQTSHLVMLLPAAMVLAFASGVVILGLHSLFLRVDMAAFDDGVVTMTWTRWPFAKRLRTLRRVEITDVLVESDDGTSRIVVVAGAERIPLTRTSTSDNVERKVQAMRDFLGFPGRPRG